MVMGSIDGEQLRGTLCNELDVHGKYRPSPIVSTLWFVIVSGWYPSQMTGLLELKFVDAFWELQLKRPDTCQCIDDTGEVLV